MQRGRGSKPTSAISVETIANRIVQIVGNDMVRVQVPREVPSFDGPEPQPLLNSPSLDVSLGDIIGPEPPIKPHSPDSSRMKVVDYPNVPTTSIKLMLFPFSLEGAARIWLEKEPPRSIQTWDDLVAKFINQFFPPSKTTNLGTEITNFKQRFDESFSEAWDRFKDLLRACPHHGFSELHQLDTFYNALNVNDQDSLNSAAGGNVLWTKAVIA
ncbi:reverse transcriptase domain-containing protein [Tanacetum coccineum]